LPDVPSLSVAANLPDIGESSTWIALVAPAHTPEAIVDKLHRAVTQIFAEPTMAERLRKAGLSADTSTPQDLDALIRSESVRWRAVIQSGVADKILE
jgi:tripartite-type tricarboxylate transporter receptor subunit TctC